MNITITRINGGLHVTPAPPYLVDYLQYSHRSFKTVNYRRVNKFESVLLHKVSDGAIVTLPGFFEKICQLIHKHRDHYKVEDLRTPMPEIDLERVLAIGLRDYQIEPISEFLMKAQVNSGILTATGGWGEKT